jgi:hypothetical protein
VLPTDVLPSAPLPRPVQPLLQAALQQLLQRGSFVRLRCWPELRRSCRPDLRYGSPELRLRLGA